jgi:Domain of unknown function (DUF4360)
MSNVLVVGSLVASLLAAPTVANEATETAAPPPERITIEVVAVNGSGCPAGTTAVAAASDNSAFTVTYSEYLAQVGVGARVTDFRKNCQLGLLVHVPPGFTFAIAQADYRGFAHLQPGATGLQRAGYYLQAEPATAYINHGFRGPYSDYWQTTDRADVASLVYSPCGEDTILNVNTELRVSAGTSDPAATTSFITMDSADGSVRTTYHFSWQTC